MLVSMSSFALLIAVVRAATVTYDFDIGWVRANPDGAFERAVMGINGQWPIPPIVASVGDRLVVNVNNELGNASTSLHFHGLYQNGTTHMDGAIGASQCAIAPGKSFKYEFDIDQPGTYWYHSHEAGQYPDGLRGPMIVKDPESPFQDQFDEEVVLTLSDWYHDEMPGLLAGFMSYANPTGAEPVPQAALMNDTQNLTVAIQPGKTYMFRIVNMAAFAAQYLWFEGHTMQVVEVDGIYTEPAEAEMLYITSAQRYSVLITAKNETTSNFAFVGSMDQDLFDTIPDGLNPNVTGWLIYDASNPNPDPAPVDEFDPFDDFTLSPIDKMPLLENPSHTVELTVAMNNLGDGANYAFFNDITYVRPKVPTLFTALTTDITASNATIYGEATNSFVLEKGQVVEIILNNDDPGKHPFHLHGHVFQTIVRSEPDAGPYVYNETIPTIPMRRDTVLVNPNGNIVLRFRADNPGIWLFHCHIEWHVASGLILTFVEAPTDLQKTLTIPEDHKQACRDAGVAMEGNAAGNVDDLFDLKGQNMLPAELPAGFETKGIVAMVFSCVAALLGLAVIAKYGLQDIGKKVPKEDGAVGGK